MQVYLLPDVRVSSPVSRRRREYAIRCRQYFYCRPRRISLVPRRNSIRHQRLTRSCVTRLRRLPEPTGSCTLITVRQPVDGGLRGHPRCGDGLRAHRYFAVARVLRVQDRATPSTSRWREASHAHSDSDSRAALLYDSSPGPKLERLNVWLPPRQALSCLWILHFPGRRSLASRPAPLRSQVARP